jgi:hypothetical protein
MRLLYRGVLPIVYYVWVTDVGRQAVARWRQRFGFFKWTHLFIVFAIEAADN